MALGGIYRTMRSFAGRFFFVADMILDTTVLRAGGYFLFFWYTLFMLNSVPYTELLPFCVFELDWCCIDPVIDLSNRCFI